MNKKTISIIGIVVSALFVVFGILAASGALGGSTYYADSAPYSYDSGFATFGGDYYTYSVNNSAEAAAGAQAAASNLREISDFLKTFCGIFMTGIGLFGACGFGIVFVGCEKPVKEPVIIEAVENETENSEDIAKETEDDVLVEETVEETTEEEKTEDVPDEEAKEETTEEEKTEDVPDEEAKEETTEE